MVNKEDALCVLGSCNFVLPPLQGLGDVGVAAGGNASLTPVCTGHALSGLSTTISKTAWICDARTWTVTTQPFNLDSSFRFSRGAAESAEYAEKGPKTKAFLHPDSHGHDRKTAHPNDERPSCSEVPIFSLNQPLCSLWINK